MMANSMAVALVALAAKGTVLLIVLWGVHKLLGRSHPAWRMTLWRMGALSLVALPLAELLAPRWQPPTLQPVLAPMAAMAQSVSQAVEQAPAPMLAMDRVDTPAPAPGRKLPPGSLVVGVWAAGVALLAARQVAGVMRLRHVLRSAEVAPRSLVQRADAIARDLGRPLDFELRIVPDGRSPFLSGLGRPVVGIPAGIASVPRDLDAVLAHELTHRAGSDHRWAAFIECVRVLWWAHPMTWWMGEAHRAACEENSDAVAARFDGDRSWYSALLARMALTTAANRPSMAISMLNGSEIMNRLRRLARAEERRAPRRMALGSMGVAAMGFALAIGTLTMNQQATGADQTVQGEPPTDLVKRLLAHEDEATRVVALGEVEAALLDPDSKGRARALSALVMTSPYRLDRSRLLDPVRKCLQDPSPTVRGLASGLLGVMGGDTSDFARLAPLADDPDLKVLEALGGALFTIRPAEVIAERDAIAMRLLAHPNKKVAVELMRGSWGNGVGEEVEARMIELSREVGLCYDAVYFGLSTRPVKSEAVADRLLEVMRDGTDFSTAERAQWGLTHFPCAPAARQRVHAALVARYDALSHPSQRDDILHYFGNHGCALSQAKLREIASDPNEVESLRETARKLLERGC